MKKLVYLSIAMLFFLMACEPMEDIHEEIDAIDNPVVGEEEYTLTADDYESLELEGDFFETEDQAKTINEVINDMTSDKSMDRLICGDVGFGKTEIIMRAAFVAAQNSKQTIILAPTTLLVEQHYKSFCARFDHFCMVFEALGHERHVHHRLFTLPE